MMKQLLLNQRKTGGRVTSLLVVLLTTLAMTLLPQRAWADVTVGFTGYGNGVIIGNITGAGQCDWSASGGMDTDYSNGGINTAVGSTANFTVISDCLFTGSLSGIYLTMDEFQDMSITAQYVNATGGPTLIAAEMSYMDGNYTLAFTEDINLENCQIQLVFSSYANSGASNITGWSGINLNGDLEVTQPVEAYNLWVGEVQVTSENCDNILGNNYPGLLSYDAENNILTMSGVDIPFGIVSGIYRPDCHGERNKLY